MGQNKQTPCQQCAAPAYGQLCQGCSLASLRSRKLAKVHTSVNTVGEFNAGIGFGTGLVLLRCVNPTESEWLGKDRDAFREWYTANTARFARGSGASHKPELLAQWTF
jgi:hypothetical protein